MFVGIPMFEKLLRWGKFKPIALNRLKNRKEFIKAEVERFCTR